MYTNCCLDQSKPLHLSRDLAIENLTRVGNSTIAYTVLNILSCPLHKEAYAYPQTLGVVCEEVPS